MQSNQQRCESVRPVISSIPNDDINPASLKESTSRIVSLGHTRPTSAHPTSSNISTPPTLPVIYCGQNVGEERRVEKRPHRIRKTETDLATALSRPSPVLRPGDKPGVSQGRYSCSICKLDYAQPQGLTRHQRERHKAKLCIYCREFAWGRPYLFREHLVKRHPGIDPDAAIIEPARTRRSATIRRAYSPLPQVPIPTSNCDSWGHVEFRSYQSHLTSFPARPSAVTRLSPVFLPEMALDSQPESTGPANKETYGQGDALLSELLNNNDECPASPSTEEHARAGANLDMSSRTVQMWLVLYIPSAKLCIFDQSATQV